MLLALHVYCIVCWYFIDYPGCYNNYLSYIYWSTEN